MENHFSLAQYYTTTSLRNLEECPTRPLIITCTGLTKRFHLKSYDHLPDYQPSHTNPRPRSSINTIRVVKTEIQKKMSEAEQKLSRNLMEKYAIKPTHPLNTFNLASRASLNHSNPAKRQKRTSSEQQQISNQLINNPGHHHHYQATLVPTPTLTSSKSSATFKLPRKREISAKCLISRLMEKTTIKTATGIANSLAEDMSCNQRVEQQQTRMAESESAHQNQAIVGVGIKKYTNGASACLVPRFFTNGTITLKDKSSQFHVPSSSLVTRSNGAKSSSILKNNWQSPHQNQNSSTQSRSPFVSISSPSFIPWKDRQVPQSNKMNNILNPEPTASEKSPQPLTEMTGLLNNRQPLDPTKQQHEYSAVVVKEANRIVMMRNHSTNSMSKIVRENKMQKSKSNGKLAIRDEIAAKTYRSAATAKLRKNSSTTNINIGLKVAQEKVKKDNINNNIRNSKNNSNLQLGFADLGGWDNSNDPAEYYYQEEYF